MMHPALTRRDCLKLLGAATFSAATRPAPAEAANADAPAEIDIGSRRELLLDDFLFDKVMGAELTLHKPEAKDVVLVCNAPWEGNTSAYFTLFRDNDRFRMYYRGSHWEVEAKREGHPEFACYAESRDGIAWEKPDLGLFEFQGSKANNIVWTAAGTHNFTPFLDGNSRSTPDARYKALASGARRANKGGGLNALKSADGVNWNVLSEAVITDGAFDSQNLAFWDAERGEYRACWRIFVNGVRAIRTATSKDFVQWEHQADLKYVDSPIEHLYTNAIQPYFRAPHLLIGFPTRFQPKNQQVEPVFMSSRDGVVFKRWSEALIPITAPRDRDGNRSNYMTSGLLQLPGNDRELSVYATEAYYAGPGSRVRRFAYRTDGFVSLHAAQEGTLVTKPLQFTGDRLKLNVSSQGETRVEIQDATGAPVAGYKLDDCMPITGDHIEHSVQWKNGGNVSALAGKPVRLRFDLRNADLYAMQFVK